MQALAKADMQQVNEVWAGLGYYRRAKFLLEGAQYVSAHLGGKLPITSEELQKIPGGTSYCCFFLQAVSGFHSCLAA